MKWLALCVLAVVVITLAVADGEIWEEDDHEVLIRSERGAKNRDVGCGDGYCTLNLLLPRVPKKFTEIIGCDISEKMIEHAVKKNYRREAKFVKFDIESKSVPTEWLQKFNHIFSFYCLHWIANKRVAFQNIFDMLQPDGDLLVTYIHKVVLYQAYLNLTNYPRWRKYCSKQDKLPFELMMNHDGNSKEATEEILKELGFSSYFCKIEKLSYTWESTSDFTLFLEAVDPIASQFVETSASGIRTSEKAHYLDDFLNELRKLDDITFTPSLKGSETVTLEYYIVVVYASKIK